MNARPKYRDLVDHGGNPTRVSFAQNMHPNPRFFKYLWRVFYHGSPEGKAFFAVPKLSTYEAMTLTSKLRAAEQAYLLYNSRQPRSGTVTPFDLSHEKWAGYAHAPSYDDDTDPEWNGHK